MYFFLTRELLQLEKYHFTETRMPS